MIKLTKTSIQKIKQISLIFVREMHKGGLEIRRLYEIGDPYSCKDLYLKESSNVIDLLYGQEVDESFDPSICLVTCLYLSLMLAVA